ncbi:MAG: hypothetical protein GC181_00885 [Bacteroidetes bacterium]|nr:hypothetical protein [Bacteroidota bacterium]
MKIKVHKLPVFLMAVTLASCAVQKKDADRIELKVPFPDKVVFVATSLPSSEEIPVTMVQISMDEFLYTIDTVAEASVIQKAQFADHQIPDTAIAACGGWYAGSGDYFYAIKSGNEISVYQGWQDEEQEDAGYHYERTRTFVFEK